MTPIAGALFEACADLRVAHASASSDDAAAMHTANALLQQVLPIALRPTLLSSATPASFTPSVYTSHGFPAKMQGASADELPYSWPLLDSSHLANTQITVGMELSISTSPRQQGKNG